MNRSESIATLAAALVLAQAEVENASKNAKNEHFKNRYADLAEVINTVRPVFAKHGIAIVQSPSFEGGIARVETMLLHSTGEWISSVCSAPVSKSDAQGVGSAITYLRRYSLAAMTGIAQEDDDGNGASAPTPNNQRQSAKKEQPPAKKQITDEKFDLWLEAYKEGRRTADDIRARFDLTKEQDTALLNLEMA